MINIKHCWKKLEYWQKGGTIGAIVATVFFIIFLLDFFLGLSNKIPNEFEFIFYVGFPAVLLGIYGCGWTFWFGDGGEKNLGELCDHSSTQFLFYFVIYVVVGYLVGAMFGFFIHWLIKNRGKIIKNLKSIVFDST